MEGLTRGRRGVGGSRSRERLVLVACVCLSVFGTLAFAQEPPPLVPDEVAVSDAVRKAVDDLLLKEEERDALRIFHGLLDEVSEKGKEEAEYAWARYDLASPMLRDHAEAGRRRGELERVGELTGGDGSPHALLIRGLAEAELGRFDLAVKTLSPLRDASTKKDLSTARDVTAAAEAIAALAQLEGRSAEDYHTVMNMLGEAQQELDRLHWPALIAQARLLIEKDNPEQAVGALHEALSLNPNCSDAWHLLGRVALLGFDFASTEKAIARLRAIHPEHLLADLLSVEMYLTQKDAVSAGAALTAALGRYPKNRTLLAAAAAVAAITYDQAGADAALKRFDEASPGHPLALAMTGKYLSMGRQYDAGEKMLRAAIERQPNWTEPRVELGLMLNQAGEDAAALKTLRGVVDLDPFNKRAVNTLKLQEELASYKRVETEHFVIRYRDEIDGVLAADMPAVLEDIYRDVTGVFGHEPSRKTLIDIMPDKRWFAIRITGMPWIWTIGACTGPVIAITPPREGRHHSGLFDWSAVIRHEFVHTVTLSQTENRIAHWFTEALAVSQEPTPRDFDAAQLLAAAHKGGELFDLEEINWAFVRPKKPTDRQLAYAQAHWMAEYVTHRFGHGTILKMLELSRQGLPQSQVVPVATGVSAGQFLEDFKKWAGEQARSWGLSPTPPTEQIVARLREAKPDELDVKLDELLQTYSDHPDLLRLAAERALEKGSDDEAALALLLRYAAARPVDPWADRRIVELTQKLGRIDTAVSHLEELDRSDQRDGAHAARLVDIYRRLGRLDDAQAAAERALHRRPYDAALREKAAAIALQRNDAKTAEHHLTALPKIEPDRATHRVRLAAFYQRQGRHADAKAAAAKARELDPAAPVERFLSAP